MDFSKLSASEKMVVYASVAVIILSVYSLIYDWGGLMALPLLGGIGALAIIFLPQMSPNTSLPGPRGSLLLIAGGGAAIFWALNTLVWLGYIFDSLDEVDTYIYLIGFAAALWLGWQSWQVFQAEGGTFRLGGAGGSSEASGQPGEPTPTPPPTPPPAPTPAAEPPAAAQPSEPRAETPPPPPTTAEPATPVTPPPGMEPEGRPEAQPEERESRMAGDEEEERRG